MATLQAQNFVMNVENLWQKLTSNFFFVSSSLFYYYNDHITNQYIYNKKSFVPRVMIFQVLSGQKKTAVLKNKNIDEYLQIPHWL
jgi:hypothetical protein|tara:strand:+ start:78 stop:332 length:255 start_codon:yes stop_codon:yes gene_type:complete